MLANITMGNFLQSLGKQLIFLLFFTLFFSLTTASATYFSDDHTFVESGIWQNRIIGLTDKAEAYIYDKDSGELLKKVNPKGHYIAGGISENGRFSVVAVRNDKTTKIILIDTKLKNVSRSYPIGESLSFNSEMRVQVSNDGSLVLFSAQFKVLLYNLNTGYLIWSAPHRKGDSNTLALSPSGRFMVMSPNHYKQPYLRSDFQITLFRINNEAEEAEVVKTVSFNDLKLKLRKQFGRAQFSRNSLNFSRLDDRYIFITFSAKREGEKNERYLIAKLSLESEKTVNIVDYKDHTDTSINWRTSYKYDNTLCELTEDRIAIGYETLILIGDLIENNLHFSYKRSPISRNYNPPEIGCSDDGQFITHVTPGHPDIRKPTIHLWKIDVDGASEIVSKLAQDEIKEAQRQAELARIEREKREEADRIAREAANKERKRLINESLRALKEVGDFVCLKGRTGWLFKYTVTLKGYVENTAGKKIQIRITDHGGYMTYNDVELSRNSVIWDDYRSWFDCDLQ